MIRQSGIRTNRDDVLDDTAELEIWITEGIMKSSITKRKTIPSMEE